MEFDVNFSLREHKEKLYQEMKRLKGEYVVTIKKQKRTLQQLKYYFVGIVKPLCELTGDSPEGVHYYLKSKFLLELMIVSGHEVWRVKDTGELDVWEMSDYIEQCIMFCAEMGVVVLPPDTFYENSRTIQKNELIKLENKIGVYKRQINDTAVKIYANKSHASTLIIGYTRNPFFMGEVVITPIEDGFEVTKPAFDSNNKIKVQVLDKETMAQRFQFPIKSLLFSRLQERLGFYEVDKDLSDSDKLVYFWHGETMEFNDQEDGLEENQ